MINEKESDVDMDKVLDKPVNGWTRFNLGPFHINSVSYLTEVHWDLIEFFQDCLTRGSGIVEFDCESDGQYVLTYSNLGMELRNGISDDLVWENANRSNIEDGAAYLLTDLVMDFDSWCWWSAATDNEHDDAAEDLALMIENFCFLLIHEEILPGKISDYVPEEIRVHAQKARAAMTNGQTRRRSRYDD